MVLAFVLAALTFAGTVQVWHIVVLAVLLGVVNVVDLPARQTFVVEMVGKEDLYSGIALNSIMNSLGRVLGPDRRRDRADPVRNCVVLHDQWLFVCRRADQPVPDARPLRD